jgi:F0F1-type ATP synthase membrane subunit b/b'
MTAVAIIWAMLATALGLAVDNRRRKAETELRRARAWSDFHRAMVEDLTLELAQAKADSPHKLTFTIEPEEFVR